MAWRFKSGLNPDACGLNPAHPVTDQNHDKKQDGKADPECQRAGHVVIARWCVTFGGVWRASPHHKQQRSPQTAQNRDERGDHKVFHASDYRFLSDRQRDKLMSSRSGRFWVVTFATVLTMGVTAALGMWQLGRASQKQALQDQILKQGDLSAWTERDLIAAPDPTTGLYRTVRLAGQWIAEGGIFLDNRQMDGRVGFFLVTPFRLMGSDRVVLVQRGWVPRDFTDRSRVPAVETPGGLVHIEGRLAPAPGKLFELGEAGAGPIRQNIDIAALSQETGLALMGVSVQQTDDVSDGLQRNWPRITAGVYKHHGYAFQWFGLCALAGILYVWFQFISPRRKRILHGPDA